MFDVVCIRGRCLPLDLVQVLLVSSALESAETSQCVLPTRAPLNLTTKTLAMVSSSPLLFSNLNTTSEHTPQVKRKIDNCMQVNQWNIIGDKLLMKFPIKLKQNSSDQTTELPMSGSEHVKVT